MDSDRKMTRKYRVGLAAICGLIAFHASALSAQPRLDQESGPAGQFNQFNEIPRAQTFVVGLPGQLESVEVYVSQLNPVGNLLVSIYAVANGEPPFPASELPLATASIPVSALPSSSQGGTGPEFVWIDLHVPLPVLPGEELVLMLQKDSGGQGGAAGIAWFGNAGSYPLGEAWRFDLGGPVICADPPCIPPSEPPSWKLLGGTGDFAFRTYVPEPSAALLLASGCATLAGLAASRAPRNSRATAGR